MGRSFEEDQKFDAIVVGSGMGGSIIASRLVEAGFTVCLLERGDFIRQEKANWDITEVSLKGRYGADETWYDKQGRPFRPRAFYNVGGASKFYGGSAFRLRRSDFEKQNESPAWPFSYEELAPWYDQAEALLNVHGARGEDPGDPGGREYPAPQIEHEPVIAALADAMREQGLRPFHTPLAVDFGPGGRCRKGSPCDGFPCMVRAKGDAENAVLRPLYLKKNPRFAFRTRSKVVRVLSAGGMVSGVEYQTDDGGLRSVYARLVVVSAGAIQSALLLLDSGIANSSGLIGRNYLCHNNTVVMAFNPFRKNPTKFQKTLSLNDFYHSNNTATNNTAAGNIQLRGKVHPEMLMKHPNALLRLFRRFVAARSIDFWVMSEDFPSPQNRVYRDEAGRVRLERTANNIAAHRGLVRTVKHIMRRAGYLFCIATERGLGSIQHQTGTMRMGKNPADSVLDEYCRSHDLPNLYVVDGSFFPSSGAVNPALTIAGQALRVADKIIHDYSPQPQPLQEEEDEK